MSWERLEMPRASLTLLGLGLLSIVLLSLAEQTLTELS